MMHAPCSVSPDWLSVHCGRSLPSRRAAPAINAISGREFQHHPIFAAFTPAHLQKSSAPAPLGLGSVEISDFLGVRYPKSLFCNHGYMRQVEAYAIRQRLCKLYAHHMGNISSAVASWPVISEEYFEYVDVMTAVDDYIAEQPHIADARRRPFAFVELGSGYGHWSFAAHQLLQSRLGGGGEVPARFLMVDAVHLEGVVRHLADRNGMSNRSWSFHVGVVDGQTGSLSAEAEAGMLHAARLSKSLWNIKARLPRRHLSGINLISLLDVYEMPCVIDVLDVDIQGGEYMAFTPAVMRVLERRVIRVHIGLHNNESEAQDDALFAAFGADQWTSGWRFIRPRKAEHRWPLVEGVRGRHESPTWGPIRFSDGVVSFLNRRREELISEEANAC